MPATLHIDANRGWGGGQAQSLGLALALAARGEETQFIAQTGSALCARLKGTYLPWEALPLRGLAGAGAVFRLARRFRESRPDVVHVHDSASQATAGLAARLAGGIPVVVTRRTVFPVGRGWLGRVKYEWCDRVICVSEAVRRACVEGGVPEERLVVVSDYVDCTYFRPDAVGREKDGDAPTLAIVGRLSREKGHGVLLKAMRGVVERIPRARLVVCGEGPEGEGLGRQAERLGISDRVEFVGFVPDVRRVLAAADVVVMPSLSEGLGLAALEAMAMGRPVVASDAGGLPESVVDGETGLIVPAGDADALAEAILSLLQNPDRAREMGAAGRERVLRHFSRPVMVDRILALYDAVLSGGAA